MGDRIDGGGPGPDALEMALADLGGRLAYPPSGDLAAAVIRRLEARPSATAVPGGIRGRLGRRSMPSGWFRAPRRRLSWAVAVAAALILVVTSAAVLVFSPSARQAVADWLGLDGVRITVTEGPLPTPRFGPLNLGERLTLEEAQARVGYRILVPEGLAPDEVYLRRPPFTDEVSLVFAARPGIPQAHLTGAGLLLTEFPGTPDVGRIDKEVRAGGTTITGVTVNGARGYWIEGEPHTIYYVDPSGIPIADTVRLAGSVLLWQQGDLTLRLESSLSLEEALRIAESLA